MIAQRGKAILERAPSDADWSVDTVAKQIYKDCVDFDKREEVGVKPVIEILRAINR